MWLLYGLVFGIVKDILTFTENRLKVITGFGSRNFDLFIVFEIFFENTVYGAVLKENNKKIVKIKSLIL